MPGGGWTTSPGGTYTTICGGQTIIGGYDKFGQNAWAKRTYTGFLTHYAVSVQFDAYFIDTWDSETFDLSLDGTLVYSESHYQGQNSNINRCGVGTTDWVKTVTLGPFNHTANSLKLEFSSTLNQHAGDESFGFKNIKITIWPVCDPACATCFGNAIYECYSCKNGWYLKDTTCVIDCGAHYWNSASGNVCSGKFSLILHALIAF